MTTYLADLLLVSSAHSLAELSALAGHPPGPGSHDRGEPRPRGKAWEQSIWRLTSTAVEEASLEEHLTQLGQRARELGLFDLSEVPAGVRRMLSLAFLSEAATCTVSLPAGLLQPFLAAGFDLELTVYPAGEGG